LISAETAALIATGWIEGNAHRSSMSCERRLTRRRALCTKRQEKTFIYLFKRQPNLIGRRLGGPGVADAAQDAYSRFLPHWHDRVHDDLAKRWLRAQLVEILGKKASAGKTAE
jgi:hypothetical protein